MAAFPGIRFPAFARAVPPKRGVLPILDAYVLREIAMPFGGALAAMFLFWFANIFVIAADYLINKGAPIFLILRFLIFRMPQATPYAFPFAALLGTLLGFSRLAADNEISAMRTSGVPLLRIVRLPLIAGAALVFVAFWMNEHVAPYAIDASTRSFYQIIYKTQTAPIEPNVFRSDPQTGFTYYVQSVDPDGKTMHNVQIWEPDRSSTFMELLFAKSAHLDGTSIVLEKPAILRVSNGQASSLAVQATEMKVPLPMGDNGQQFLSSGLNDINTEDTHRLAQDIQFRKATGQGGSDLAARELTLGSKYAYPFASFIAVLIALPLAVRYGKKGRMLGLALAILVLFVYYVFVATAAAFGKNGALDPYFAAWLPNVVMGIVGGWLIWHEDR